MTQEEFTTILKEFDYSDDQILRLWQTRPSDDLVEELVRETAKRIAPMAKVERDAQDEGWKYN